MLSFHFGDVGQTARPREREKSNIRTLGRVHKVKSHSLGHECLIKIRSPRDNIDRCIIHELSEVKENCLYVIVQRELLIVQIDKTRF